MGRGAVIGGVLVAMSLVTAVVLNGNADHEGALIGPSVAKPEAKNVYGTTGQTKCNPQEMVTTAKGSACAKPAPERAGSAAVPK